jgi:hypothetical protein
LAREVIGKWWPLTRISWGFGFRLNLFLALLCGFTFSLNSASFL